jgi:hypothetical protein
VDTLVLGSSEACETDEAFLDIVLTDPDLRALDARLSRIDASPTDSPCACAARGSHLPRASAPLKGTGRPPPRPRPHQRSPPLA